MSSRRTIPEEGQPADLTVDGLLRNESGFSTETLEMLGQIGPERLEPVFTALENREPAYLVDWQDLPLVKDVPGRLAVLARVQALVPDDNIEVQKDVHNVAIENHLKLLFEAAGTRGTLRAFLELGAFSVSQSTPEREAEPNSLAYQAFWLWAPAAEIMGWYELKEELEREAFTQLHPGELTKIAETYRALGGDKALHTATERYSHTLREEIVAAEPELKGNLGITARRKSYYSVWRKCQKRGQDGYELSDFIGARILVNSKPGEEWAVEKCYQVVGVLNGLDSFGLEYDRHKDYIKEPKPNGYQSFHMTFRDPDGGRFEVQVRTTAMDERMRRSAETSHMTYDAANKLTPGKYIPGRPPKSSRLFRWRKQAALTVQTNPDVPLAELRPREVLVFAPDGNLFHMPEGATALDASFHIHSERALRTRFIKVNGKPVEFDDPVQNGDLIEIDYARRRPDGDGTWTKDWLQKASTKRTRNRILKADKRQNADQYQERAIRAAALEFPELDDPIGLLNEADRSRLVKRYGVQSFEIVLRQIGAKSAKPGKLLEAIRRKRSPLA